METHTLSETSRYPDNFYTFPKYNKPLEDFLFQLFITFLRERRDRVNDEEEETENRMFQVFFMNSRSIIFQGPANDKKKKNKSSSLTSSMDLSARLIEGS